MENQDGPQDQNSRPVSGRSQAQAKEDGPKSKQGSQTEVPQNEVANPDGEVAVENGNGEVLDGSPAAANQEDGAEQAVNNEIQEEAAENVEEDGQVDGQQAEEGESPTKEPVEGEEDGQAAEGEVDGQVDGEAAVKEEEESPEVLAKKEEFELENDACIAYIKDKIELDKFTSDMWTLEHARLIRSFITDPNFTKLFFWVDQTGLRFNKLEPPVLSPDEYDTDFLYLVKNTQEDSPVTIDNIEHMVHYGMVGPEDLKYLLKVMRGQFIPAFLSDQSWPDNVKKDFVSQMHKFMASVTEAAYQREHTIRLYIPNEDLSDKQAIMQDKDLIQRLESILLQWSKQIKEIVNNQEIQNDSELAGPLDEIEYWKSRQKNLSFLNEQLNSQELKKIVDVLQMTESTYLKGFQNLANQINEGYLEAEDNLKYLKSLQDPCRKLEESTPRDIPDILPQLLQRVRMISEYSKFYNNKDRIAGLLRKISNEIIKRCKAQINLQELLEGDVEKCMDDLNDSINCGSKWRTIYTKMEELIKKKSKGKGVWDFNHKSIFAQIDAFVQRCLDLKEICEGQMQFARKGGDSQMPIFGGTKGREIINLLEENRVRFKKLLDKIKDSDQDLILDIKSTKWHDDYNNFKNGMKDLDNMYESIINHSFENISTIEQGVEMLEAFESLARRSSIKQSVQNKAQYVFHLFDQEVNKAKQEFDNTMSHPESFNFTYGKHSGKALWFRSMLHRLDRLKASIDKLNFVGENDIKKDCMKNFEQVYNHFKNNLKEEFVSWKEEISKYDTKALEDCLQNAVLVRTGAQEGKKGAAFKGSSLVEKYRPKEDQLENNFDKGLMRLIIEANGWFRFSNQFTHLGIIMPEHVRDFVNIKRENLRIYREQVMRVVREYNQIIDEMEEPVSSIETKKLFEEHLKDTNKALDAGLRRIRFSVKSELVLEGQVNDWLRSCRDLHGKLKTFRANNSLIHKKCKEIAELQFIELDKRNAIELTKFEEDQERCRKRVSTTLKTIFEDIKKILDETYSFFYKQSDKIQSLWFKYVSNIDHEIEKSLKKAIRLSLVELNKTLNGDTKTEATPIFKVSVVLANGNPSFNPNTETLQETVRQTIAAITELTSNLLRMEQHMLEIRKSKDESERLAKEAAQAKLGIRKEAVVGETLKSLPEEITKRKVKSFYETISGDREIDEWTNKILLELNKSCKGLNDLLNPWHKDTLKFKDKSEKRFAHSMVYDRNEPLNILASELENFDKIQTDIQENNKSTEKHHCIQLDNTIIKSQIIDKLILLQNTLLSTMQEKALQELSHLYNIVQSSAAALGPYPYELSQLRMNIEVWEEWTKKKPLFEVDLNNLEDKFKFLVDKYGLQLKKEDAEKRDQLRKEWNNFIVLLDDIQQRNAKRFGDMKNETIKTHEEFNKESDDMRNKVFAESAPYSAISINNEKAFILLNEFKDQVRQLRKKEEEMKPAFVLFKMSPAPNADLDFVDKEIQVLEQVWGLKEEWDQKWERELKKIKFRDIDTDKLEDIIDEYRGRINDFPKEIRKWEILKFLQDVLDQFLKTLPLINKLKHPSMRARHWGMLKSGLGASDLDHESDSFNLGEVYNLKLNQHPNPDTVESITEAARAQFQIENTLENIKKHWDTQEIDMERYKKDYWKIKKPEDIFSILEEHMVTLSGMKTNTFFYVFESQIVEWENTLTRMVETLELLMTVQRQWIYLNSIFESQKDGKAKQLIGDNSRFKAQTKHFIGHLERINNDRNALKALIYDRFSQELSEISKNLEEIQKILLQLLEMKRKDFPRFYFLSNDDLFELLGNSRDLNVVNKHMKKLFEGIKTLDISPQQQKGGKLEIIGMTSPEGEKVEFSKTVIVDNEVDRWLGQVQETMRTSLKVILLKVTEAIKPKETKWIPTWIHDFPGQLLLMALQMRWTRECSDALNKINTKIADRVKAWQPYKAEQRRVFEELTKLVRKITVDNDRLKLVAMITVMIHMREVVDNRLYKNCQSPLAFEWQSQLRFEQESEGSEAVNCRVEQMNFKEKHGFEYQGNNGRLVVTNLTDRCYLTLTTAMHLLRGGAPQGPAGTGKTETVKDLGKGMGKFVLVFNCSEGLEYSSLGRMFSGLVQTGGWGCFDEFNRIEVEVLSVIATQISTIFQALRLYQQEGIQSFFFETHEIGIDPSCGIFITMNPGYAGRSELPDNLKSMFRPMSMVVPNSDVIAHTLLSAEGFAYGDKLSKKIITLYDLMVKQLSKQDHYDFGLRAVKSVLTAAGRYRRLQAANDEKKDKEKDKGATQLDFQLSEEERLETLILMRAIRDMNLPKFVAEDIPLFNALFNVIFQVSEASNDFNESLQNAIYDVMAEEGYQPHSPLVTKIIQLNESKETRHGNMLVGSTLSGKTTCWKLLQKALNKLNKENAKKYPLVRITHLNPKSIDIKELYGYVNPDTAEWYEGVLSCQMAAICKEESPDRRWMILDGPVDTIWIESMNTVLDDNKVLTLLNGDRIGLPSEVALLFEVEDLSAASPATVSRCGMVYMDINELGWKPYVDSWIDKKKDPELRAYLDELFYKWIRPLLDTKRKFCKETVAANPVNLVISLCKVLDALNASEAGIKLDDPPKNDEYWLLLEKWFAFALLWSVGATVNEDGRKFIDSKFRDIESFFPANNVYDYFISSEKNDWAPWEEKLTTVWKPPPNTPFHKLIVPTVDTFRNRYILQTLLKAKALILVVGQTGTGKTAIINSLLGSFDDTYTSFYINFSAQTTSAKTQEIIESKLVRRAKGKMTPDAGKKGIIFIDDLNMPRKDTFGSQPPLELLRQFIEYGGWYDRQSLDIFKVIDNIQLIAAMGPPGGGRAEISQRLQSKFNMINFTFPNDTQVKRIFQSILTSQLNNLDEEIRPLIDPLASATINLYLAIQANFLPTPTRAHYVFNMRDISKVVQGVCQLEYCDSKLNLIKVWVHECLRVFCDRMINEEDRAQLKKLIGDRLEIELGSNLKECSSGEDDTVFVDFIDEDNATYQEVTDREVLKKVLKTKLDTYNSETKSAPLNIVLFKEAILSVCKIHRIIKLSRGHGFLIGEGGSGRHSLTRLAASICGYKIFQIKITKNYESRQFREDLKKYIEEVGTRRTPAVFIFSDNEILQESFIEDINSLISSGEVPNLFKKEEAAAIRDKCRKDAKNQKIDTEEGIWEFFLNKVQSNLHVVLCMSKTGDNLRNYTRMYPGLINNTTMIWFMPWPQEALYEVADHYLASLNDVDDNSKKAMSGFFSDTHMQVLASANRMWMELKRMYYVTATNYIELVQGYLALLQEKRKEVGNEINKLNLGLEKLAEAGRNMEELSVALDHAHNDLTQKQKDCEELMIRITHESREADEKQKEVESKKVVLEKDRIETETLAASAKVDLDAAMPALMEASEKIDKLTNSEFAEIKAYSTPPEPVMAVMSVILIFLGKVKDVAWASAKSALSDPNFVSNLKEFSQKEKDNISTRTLNKVEKYTSRGDMSPADVRKISSAAGTLWEWCLAMEKYAKAWRDIEPKRNNVRKLEDKLKKNEDELRQLEEKYLQLKGEVDRLKSRYEQANDDKEKFKNDAQELRIKLERAEKLVYSLSSSKERWAADKRRLLEQYENLIGDTLISAAFLSYSGPFPSEYRERLVSTVMLPYIKSMKIPHSRNYNVADFLAKPTDIQRWNGQGLPTDPFSTENGVIVVKSRRWPLMIDPQMQANKWIKSMEREKLILLDPQTENYMAKIERAIFDGMPVLLQNLGEDIDPSLDPVLNKSLKTVGDRTVLVLGDREIGYNPNFKLYMTTKFSNPKYKAEVSTKVTLVNFTVKEKGLEEQLLGKLIENLEPELEKRKNELVQKTAKNQAKLKESDDEVLRLLMETKGSLVDDDNLVTKLQNSKATEDEIKQQIESSSQTMKKTLALRENYRPLGTMASHLFFVLNDLNKIDHMYQFSLESYIDLFVQAIPKKDERHMMLDTLQSKLDTISERHKIGVYKYACRSLFEKDKILLSMQMTAKLSDKVNPEEYSFFLRGITNVDRTQQPPNPAPEWLTPSAWDAINALDKLAKFDGLIGSFMNSTKEWRRWYMSEAPETEVLPGEWSNRFDTPLRMMILLKAMRPDRVMLACREFVEKGLGDKFVNPPEVNFESIFNDSKPSTPIVIILSPGVDPYPQIEALAQRQKIPLYPLSLGQGQSDRAKDKIRDGVKNGHWVFLANCHLSISFLAELEKLLDRLKIEETDSSNKFRLWLTTNPHPKFSISILQKAIKVTTEPPRGLKANMLRLYTQMQEEQFRVDYKENYKKLLFCLCWFHSIIIERKRFKSLGWNVSYDFNDSDFQICENIIKNYLDKSSKGVDENAKIIPWDAIRYLIYEINYGGRVTDECDRTLLRVYANEFFNERVITEENYNLADPNLEFQYTVPDDSNWKPPQDKGKELQFKSQTAYFFEQEIRKYPDIDPPGAFGQHINAVISSQISDTNTLIESILSLQPRETSQGTESMEEVVEKIVNDLKDKVPEVLNLEEIEERNKHIPDDDPYKIVMKQEIARYNKLLVTLEASLKNLLDGIKGRILISEDLEKIMESLYESKVPRAWKFAYPSLKPLNSWIADLNARVKEFKDWAFKGTPMVFWISSFTYPKGFLTAILQQTARKLPKVSIDMLGLDFYFLNVDNTTKAAPEGVYVHGLYLEGAKWDWNKSILLDADAMTLHHKMPVMHFRPIITEGKKQKKGQSYYSCPTYMYPVRGDASFVLYVNLPCGTLTDPSFWVKRGTSLLMSLSE